MLIIFLFFIVFHISTGSQNGWFLFSITFFIELQSSSSPNAINESTNQHLTLLQLHKLTLLHKLQFKLNLSRFIEKKEPLIFPSSYFNNKSI